MAKPSGLGKGLSSMIDPTFTVNTPGTITNLSIYDVEPNNNQPRKYFDPEKMEALTSSISELGVILPIIVVKKDENVPYKIIAGERRWRAAKKAGLKTIPSIIKDYESKEAAEVALIENLQREDLNAVEEAEGYKSLIDSYKMTQEDISKRVGKSRSAVTNSLRLLNLPDHVKKLMIEKKLSSGHARALLSFESDEKKIELANRIVNEGLSVRQIEAYAKSKGKNPVEKKKPSLSYCAEIELIGDKLSSKLGTKVILKPGAKKSKIEIEYYSNEDLERIMSLLG